MPVRARSRSSISAMICLPERLIARSSSSSRSTPSRAKPPSRASAGGSSTSVASIASRTSDEIVELGDERADERRLQLGEHACGRAGSTVERLLEADEIARSGGAERRARDQPLEILHRLDRVAELAALGRAERELLDGVEPIADRLERHAAAAAATSAAGGCRSTSPCDRARRAATRRVRPPILRGSRDASASSDR